MDCIASHLSARKHGAKVGHPAPGDISGKIHISNRLNTTTGDNSLEQPQLIAESQDAQSFLQEVLSNIESYLHFEGETFQSTAPAVFATSSVDLQGESFGLEALKEAARHIQQDGLWINYEHDPSIQPIGRAIAARTFYAPESKLHFVAGLIGFYGGASYKRFATSGAASDLNAYCEQYPSTELNERPALSVQLETNPHEIAGEDVDKLLNTAPPSVRLSDREQFRKSAV